MIKYLIQTSPHDAITSQEVVGVLGVEEVEKVEGVAELGPIAVLKKGQGVLAYDFIFSGILLVVATLWLFYKIFRYQ